MKELELQLEAEKLFPVNNTGSMFMANREQINNSYKQEGFIAGATSNAAKEYWKKELEKEKLEFAINQLKQHTVHNVIPYVNRIDVINKIQELEQKLNELNL